MNKLFPNANINFSKLKLSNNSSYSITKPHDAKIIEKIINNFGKNLTILDATANVGGDSINFGLNPNVKKVYSIEINKNTYNNLVNNIKVYGLENKVECINGDSVEIIKQCKYPVDILFIDAPWGGKNYKSQEYLNLEMGNLKLYQVVEFALKCKNIKNIVLKTPYNFNLKHLLETPIHGLTIHKIKTFKKFYLILTFINT